MTPSATQQVNLDDLIYQYYGHRSTRLSREFLRLVPTRSKKLSDLGPGFFQDLQIAASFDALVRFYELVCVGIVVGYLPSDPGSSFIKSALSELQHALIQSYCRHRRDSAAIRLMPTLFKDRSSLMRLEIGAAQSGAKAMIEVLGLVSRIRDDQDVQHLKILLQNSEGIGNQTNDLLDALSSPATCSMALLGSSSHSALVSSGLRGFFNLMQVISDLERLLLSTPESARIWLLIPFGADLTPEIIATSANCIATINRWSEITDTEIDAGTLSSLQVWNEAVQYVGSNIIEAQGKLRVLVPDAFQVQSWISGTLEPRLRLGEQFTQVGRSELSETALKDLVLSRLTREFGSNIRVNVLLKVPGSRGPRVDAVFEQKGVTTLVQFKTHQPARARRQSLERKLSELRRYAGSLPEADRHSIRFVVVELLSGVQQSDADQFEAERNALRAQSPFPFDLRSYRLSDLQDELSFQWRSLQE